MPVGAYIGSVGIDPNQNFAIHNSQHNQSFFDHFQTYTAIYYGHSELSREEKSKFEFEEKKFSLLLKREV